MVVAGNALSASHLGTLWGFEPASLHSPCKCFFDDHSNCDHHLSSWGRDNQSTVGQYLVCILQTLYLCILQAMLLQNYTAV